MDMEVCYYCQQQVRLKTKQVQQGVRNKAGEVVVIGVVMYSCPECGKVLYWEDAKHAQKREEANDNAKCRG